MIGPIRLYAHEDHEEVDWHAEKQHKETPGVPLEILQNFFDSKPLYEVEFDFYLDPTDGGSYCTKVDLGDGNPFVRELPKD